MALQNLTFTRRRLLMLAAGAGLPFPVCLYGAGGEFWNKKEPGAWSPDEIDRLVSRSPWAKEVNAMSATISRPYGGAKSGGVNVGDPGIGGGPGGMPGAGGYPGGGRSGGGRDAGPIPLSYKATVRWESAKPIQEAIKTPLTEGLVGAYVISVSGVPILARSRQRDAEGDASEATVSKGLSEEVLERIKELTYLEPKGKSPAQPSVVRKGPVATSGMPSILFGFPREVMPISEDDREVVFTTQLGPIDIKAKFTLKDMMYHKELAL